MLAFQKPASCRVCGSPLEPHLSAVRDEVYGVTGVWNLARCQDPACGVVYLSHDLSDDQLSGFYADYGTHSQPVLHATGVKRIYRDALKHISARRLGYPTRQDGAAGYLAALLDRIPFFRQTALARMFWLPYRQDGRLIEIGFGNGQSLVQLREAGWAVAGSEFDAVCVEQARALGLDVVQGSFFDARYETAASDAVVASHVIEHVPDPVAFVHEAARVLRPGGYLVLVTPNAASRDARRMGRNWRGLEVPRHLSIHTPGSLRAMAEQAGFTDIEVFGTPLGGFIMQQSRELSRGSRVSSSQGLKTVPYSVLASAVATWKPADSDEIVLRCRLSA